MDLESVARNAQGIRALARSLLRDDAAADDVVQEAYLAALKKPPDGDVPAHAWLVGVVRRLAWKRRRTDARRDRRERAAAVPESSPPETEVVERAEIHRALMVELLALPQPYRTTLLLRYFDGLSLKEIAARLDVPVGTVGTHVHRGLDRLRDRLDDAHGGRRHWSAALLPLVGALPAPSPVPAQLGVAAMSAKKSSLLAAALLLALLFTLGLWTFRSGERHGARDDGGGRSAATETAAIEAGDDGRAPIDFARIDRDLDLHGVVVDARGDPAPGALVKTFWRPWRRAGLSHLQRGREIESGPETRTARDGTFSLRLRRGQEVDLRATAGSLGTAELAGCQAGERVRLVLGATTSLEVTVVDDDERPVPGAEVHAFKSRQIAPFDQVVEETAPTDERGIARFPALPAGGWVYVEADDGRRSNGIWERVALHPGRSARARIRIREGRTLRGRVIDGASGEGIAGAVVGSGWTHRLPVTTDEHGAFTYPNWCPDGTFKICAHATGYGRAGVVVGANEEIELELERAAAVVGVIRDGGGRPVPGALLSLRARDEVADFATFAGATSDADGGFRFESAGLRAPHTLSIVATGFGRKLVDFDVGDAPDTVDLGTIRLDPPNRIEGRVLDGEGRPLANVLVRLVGANTDRGARRPGEKTPYRSGADTELRRTDDLGRFRFPDLSPGAYTVTASPAARKPASGDVELKRGEPCDDVELRVPGGHQLKVRVFDGEGEPVLALSVQVDLEDSYSMQAQTNMRGEVEFVADTPFVRVGLYDVKGEYVMPAFRRIEPGEETIRFDLERAAEIRGVVRAMDGSPLPQAALRVEQDGRPVVVPGTGSAFSDMEGNFRLSVPARGVFDVYLTGFLNRIEGVNDHQTEKFAGERLGVAPGTAGVVLQARRVERGPSLRVRVRAPDGSPLKMAQVFANLDGVLVPGANRWTDADGWATLENLPDTDIAVYARVRPETPGAGDWLKEQAWPVRADGREIEMRLRRARRIRGVVMRDKEPQPDAYVSIYAQSDMIRMERSGADGSFELAIDAAKKGPLWLHASWLADDGTRYQARIDGFDPDAGEPVRFDLAPAK